MRSVTLSENFSQTIRQQVTKPSSTTTGLMSVAAAAAGMQVWDSGSGILIKVVDNSQVSGTPSEHASHQNHTQLRIIPCFTYMYIYMKMSINKFQNVVVHVLGVFTGLQSNPSLSQFSQFLKRSIGHSLPGYWLFSQRCSKNIAMTSCQADYQAKIMQCRRHSYICGERQSIEKINNISERISKNDQMFLLI